MRIRPRICRGWKFLWRTFLRNKLVWIFCSVIIIVALVIRSTEEEESALLHEYAKFENKSRSFIRKTNNLPIIWWNQGYRLSDETIHCPNSIKCDVYSAHYKLLPNSDGAYIFYASRLEFDDLPLPRNPDKVLWALSHEESPRNVPELLHETGLNLFNFSSTFSRYSNVPFPLQTMESLEDVTSSKYFVKTSLKNNLLKELSPIIYMSSNCHTFSDRDNYVKELMKYIPIDSYGTCLNNKKWPKDFPEDYLNNLNDGALLDFVARYKFAIAIENGVCDDYITEKFWRPIKLGVVPIYFGSPSIEDWFPNNKSAILIQDFPTPKLLSEYLYELLQNDKKYEQYLEHKTKGLISNKQLLEELESRSYQTDIEKTSLELECFVCKKLHENLKRPKFSVVTKSHYNCTKPISALTKQPIESEIPFWELSKRNAERLYNIIQLFR